MDPRDWNREAWDRQVREGNRWTVSVSPEEVARARHGDWQVLLTPTRPVPRTWFPASLAGVRILGLASGGGQQCPLLAAARAVMTVFDASPAQLARDREVATRESLTIATVEGDMRDLSAFADASFDLVFHPCSNCFCESILPVWREAFRVLRPGGALLAGFCNPIQYAVGEDKTDLRVKHAVPYSDIAAGRIIEGEPVEFGHTLEDQVGGQLDAGFHLTGFFEDTEPSRPLAPYLKEFIATRAVKP